MRVDLGPSFHSQKSVDRQFSHHTTRLEIAQRTFFLLLRSEKGMVKAGGKWYVVSGLQGTFTVAQMLLDSFGRTHDYLRISLTETCNYRCLYCIPSEDIGVEVVETLVEPRDINEQSRGESHIPLPTLQPGRMTADEIVQLATMFVSAGVTKIRLTGGEPLLRSDAMKIISRLSELDVELCLTTNASRLKALLPELRRVGLRHFNISLDSLDAETFRRLTGRDEYSIVRANIDTLLQSDNRVKVNMVVMNGYNHSEIPDFIEWTQHSDIQVRFIEFMPFPGNHWRPEKLMSMEEILGLAHKHFPVIEKLQDNPHDTDKKYRVAGYKGTFSIISTMSAPFCEGCNRLRLSADGKMRNCLFASHEVDLAAALRRGENVMSLIESCVQTKAAALGGHQSAQWALERTHAHERSMMAIGG